MQITIRNLHFVNLPLVCFASLLLGFLLELLPLAFSSPDAVGCPVGVPFDCTISKSACIAIILADNYSKPILIFECFNLLCCFISYFLLYSLGHSFALIFFYYLIRKLLWCIVGQPIYYQGQLEIRFSHRISH